MSKRFEQTLDQRDRDGKQAHEKIFNVITQHHFSIFKIILH